MIPRHLRRRSALFIVASVLLVFLAYMRMTLVQSILTSRTPGAQQQQQQQNSQHSSQSKVPSTKENSVVVPTHLIVVACHAIYIGPGSGPGSGAHSSSMPALSSSNLDDGVLDRHDAAAQSLPSRNESNWLIEPFQVGETATYVKHVEAGVRLLAEAMASAEGDAGDSGGGGGGAILVFSGGATKRAKTAKPEGQGYLDVALEHDLFGLETTPPTLRQRIFVDAYATDSYQNVLLSLIQYPLFVQRLLDADSNTDGILADHTFPHRLTIVSHEFKRARFLNLHLPAIHWNGITDYVGINPPFDPDTLVEVEKGEQRQGFGAWKEDLYGVGEALTRKRANRGWNGDTFKKEVLEKLPPGELTQRATDLVFWDANNGKDRQVVRLGKSPWE